MKWISYTASKNPCYRENRTIVPKGVMIHSIGVPQPDPKKVADQFNRYEADACVHAVIGTGEEVYQLLPWEYRAWHCGSGPKGSGNDTYLSFEMTEPSTIRYTGGANWIDENPESTRRHVYAVYHRAVELAAYLCRKYGLNPVGEGVLISHAEGHRRGIASNHADVEHIWSRENLSMEQFRKDVASAVKKASEGGQQETQGIRYTVQAGAFEKREYAQDLVDRLKKAGFVSYIKEVPQ